MRQESTKEPALALEDGCFLCRVSLYEKGFGIVWESKLSPRFQAPFSVCFANRGASSADCRFVDSRERLSPFFLRKKRAGGHAAAAARSCGSPLVSPRRNGGPPRAHKSSAPALAGKKKGLKPRDELARTFGFSLFSYSLPQHSRTQNCLSGGF